MAAQLNLNSRSKSEYPESAKQIHVSCGNKRRVVAWQFFKTDVTHMNFEIPYLDLLIQCCWFCNLWNKIDRRYFLLRVLDYLTLIRSKNLSTGVLFLDLA